MKTSNMLVAGFTAFALSGYALAQSAQSDPAKAAGSSGEVSSPLIADPATTQVPASPAHPALEGAQQNQTNAPDAARGSNASSNAASQDSMNEARKLSDEGATAAGDSTPTTRAARADRN